MLSDWRHWKIVSRGQENIEEIADIDIEDENVVKSKVIEAQIMQCAN